MNKKLQVFISSTYSDLIKERQAAVKTILNAGHIPVGMNLIETEKSQIETICKLIDESDVFILILGRCYGTINKEFDMSYTELEYHYALSKKIPVFSIVLDDEFHYENAISHNNHLIIDDNRNQYNIFKFYVSCHNVTHVINTLDIQVSIMTILDNIDLLYTQYPETPSPFNVSLFNAEIRLKTKHYYDIFRNFKMKSILNVTANKCIVDPLGNPISDIEKIRIDVSEVNDWMLNELNKTPSDLYQLSSSRFEELIAEILIRKGYKVELTPATRDGGKDIYAAHKDDLGSFLYIVECKKYKPTHKVGINVLRDLYGVLSKERATYGIAVTTSYFSKPAKEFQQELQFQMSLKDFDSIKQWLHDVT